MAGGACLAALTMIAPSALADPTAPSVPPHRPLNGVGSDTTQDVMNALANVITIGGSKVISSWDASPQGSQITTGKGAVNDPICTITRPSGSGNGVTALRRSMTNGPGGTPDGCLQFARSSSSSTTTVPVDAARPLSLVPFAVDGLTYAIRDDSTLSSRFTQAQLQSIYNCGLPTTTVIPKLPQFGSGTRASFISQVLGQTDSPTFASTRPCISEVNDSGGPLLENTGTLLTSPLHIAPYSVAQYNAQINDVIPDVHGRTVLGSINSVSPNVLNTAQLGTRTVFNVIPTNQEAVSPTSDVFVGPSSHVCTNTNTITRQGFAPLPSGQCGVITIRR